MSQLQKKLEKQNSYFNLPFLLVKMCNKKNDYTDIKKNANEMHLIEAWMAQCTATCTLA